MTLLHTINTQRKGTCFSDLESRACDGVLDESIAHTLGGLGCSTQTQVRTSSTRQMFSTICITRSFCLS